MFELPQSRNIIIRDEKYIEKQYLHVTILPDAILSSPRRLHFTCRICGIPGARVILKKFNVCLSVGLDGLACRTYWSESFVVVAHSRYVLALLQQLHTPKMS